MKGLRVGDISLACWNGASEGVQVSRVTSVSSAQ